MLRAEVSIMSRIAEIHKLLGEILSSDKIEELVPCGIRLMAYDRREWLRPFLASEKEQASEIERLRNDLNGALALCAEYRQAAEDWMAQATSFKGKHEGWLKGAVEIMDQGGQA